MKYYWVLLATLITLLIVFILWIQIEIKIIIRDGKNFSYIVISVLRLFRFRLNLFSKINVKDIITLILQKIGSEKKAFLGQTWEFAKKFFTFYNNNSETFSFFKSKLILKTFTVRSRIGTGDAASTALTIGGCYAVLSIISQYLKQQYDPQESKFEVSPYFEGSLFDLDLDCIINFRFGHIIITGLKILTKNKKAVS